MSLLLRFSLSRRTLSLLVATRLKMPISARESGLLLLPVVRLTVSTMTTIPVMLHLVSVSWYGEGRTLTPAVLLLL